MQLLGFCALLAHPHSAVVAGVIKTSPVSPGPQLCGYQALSPVSELNLVLILMEKVSSAAGNGWIFPRLPDSTLTPAHWFSSYLLTSAEYLVHQKCC